MIQAQTTTQKTNVIVTQRPANELAISITGRPYISWSQVSCMRRRLLCLKHRPPGGESP